MASFLFNIFLAYSSHYIKCLTSLCKSSLNFSISIIVSKTLSMSAFKLLCSADSAAFYFTSAYLYKKLWSRSPCAFLSTFYWFLSLAASSLFLFIPLSSYELICFKSDYDFMHYFSSLLVLSLSYSLSLWRPYNFLLLLCTSYSLVFSPSISYIITHLPLLCH